MKRAAIFIAALVCFVSVRGQNLQTGYFMSDYAYSYRLNPAFSPSYSFVGLPGISSASVGLQGNIGLDNVLYPGDGGLVTFLHPDVSASDVLSGLDKTASRFSADVAANILAIGIRTGNLFNTIDVSVRNYVDGSVPYDFFRFLKDGASESGDFDLSGLQARGTSFVEIGFGSAWGKRKVTYGIRLKGLVGVADFNLKMDRAHLSLDGKEWKVDAEGTLTGAYDGMKIRKKKSATGQYDDVIDFENSEYGLLKGMNGFGLAMDFGLKADLGKVELSASVTDVGANYWFNNLRGRTPGESWTFTGGDDLISSGEGGIGGQFSGMVNELTEVFEFRNEGDANEIRILPFTARAGVKVEVAERLSLGALGTYRHDNAFRYWEGRAIADYKPFKALELAASAGYNTYGLAFGAMLSVHCPGVSFFVGTDGLFYKVNPQFIPLGKPNTDIALGLNIAW